MINKINKVIISHFKKFERQEFRIPQHLVVAGPNNSGKTTLLQAVAAWSEIAEQWRNNNPNLARGNDGNYPQTNLNRLRFYSVPLADFEHLWSDKNVQQPVSIELHTDQWKIGFEVFYKETELVSIRPGKNVAESDLDKFVENPLIPVYIPPFSGIKVEEPVFNEEYITAQLAQAQPGTVLRNLLLAVSRNKDDWKKLTDAVKSFFGCELTTPSPGARIFIRYRHSRQSQFYDLSSAASGFLQVLTVYAVVLGKKPSVLLIDEPDAHLHILLQNKMYAELCRYSHAVGCQLIISTHSEYLINAVDLRYLCVLLKRPKFFDSEKERKTLSNALKVLSNMDITLALDTPGILYVEGLTDIAILRAWAKILDHRLLPFLEKPFWKPVVCQPYNRGKGIQAKEHFESLKLVREDIRGVQLCDSDGRQIDASLKILESGLVQMHWQRYEIESYLIHPEAIARCVESVGGHLEMQKAQEYLNKNIPLAVIKAPLCSHDYFRYVKAKDILSKTWQEAGLISLNDYSLLAEQMKPEEIPAEVKEKLEAIADHLGISTSGCKPVTDEAL